MAGRDEKHHRTNRRHHDDTKAYEKRNRLTVEHKSDDERERGRYWPFVEKETAEDKASRPETHSPTFAHPLIPKASVSEASEFRNFRSHHSDCCCSTAATHTETISRGLHQPQSRGDSSGVLRERTYQYEELHPSEFRLVLVYRRKMTTIKCEIIHHSLTNPPSYTAISYAWGDADDKRSIQIGKANIPVAASLFGALEAVRKRDEDTFVWVDALCINQQNRDERSQQVQLMTEIYAKAKLVAIWLGPSKNDSQLATDLLLDIADITDIAMGGNDSKKITDLLLSPTRLRAVEALVHLFQRDYWKRLWVVQEVFNAKAIMVFCGGTTELPWRVYQKAAHIYSQVLVYEGPNSLLDMDSANSLLREGSLLNIMRAYRRKLASDPRDKIFGILGVLPEDVRKEFLVDYSLSIKEVYTNVADFLLSTTNCLDVICESIHFPKQAGIANLPSWVPDWSRSPETRALGYSHNFTAAADTDADWRLLDERRNELEISAIYIDTVWKRGVAVATLCTSADYLMAFLHWRAILSDYMSSMDFELQKEMEEAFCRTICLGQIPLKQKPDEWMRNTYRVFATLLRNRLPKLPLDDALSKYIDDPGNTETNHRQLLQSDFGSHMMGRCFFLTEAKRLGMGTGCMLPGDIIVVPLGCRTPIIIREADKRRGIFQLVGDVYLDGYMDGKAVERWKAGKKKVEKFVLV
ncbi:heterokaryon incompatibility protein-domain-containing protein [Ustulina deusta]|nr:heterokaryon incompatibility protein-domain-containing protein [Ustulina deusta]